MREQAARIGPATLTRYAEVVQAGLGEMRGATAPRLLLEVACARLLLPSASDAESALLQRVERIETRLDMSIPAPAPAPAPAEPAAQPVVQPSRPPRRPAPPESKPSPNRRRCRPPNRRRCRPPNRLPYPVSPMRPPCERCGRQCATRCASAAGLLR